MSNRYEYKVDEKTKEFTVKELGENPDQINAHIESLRRWVQSMPHLQCPTDAEFLLRFLRVSKFDHIKAQKRIDNFCTVRASERGIPSYFKPYSINDPMFEEYLNIRFFLPLGNIDSGERIILLRYSDWDLDKIPLLNVIRLFYMSLDAIISDEDCQIFGYKFLFNFHGINKRILEALCDTKMLKYGYISFQDSYPMRFKGQIFLSDSTVFDVFFQIVLFFLNEKIKQREMGKLEFINYPRVGNNAINTNSLKHDITKLKNVIPGLENILLKEYGGKGDSLDECAEKWNRKFRTFYKDGHPFRSIKVNESKRPSETLGFLAKHADYKGEIPQTERKQRLSEQFVSKASSYIPAFTDVFDEESFYIFFAVLTVATFVGAYVLSHYIKIHDVDDFSASRKKNSVKKNQ